MGFVAAGCAVIFVPKIFIKALIILGFIQDQINTLLIFVGLSEFLGLVVWSDEPNFSPQSSSTRPDCSVPVSMIREVLPVVKLSEKVVGSGEEAPESCAVCLYELEREEEIRWLMNCRHVFHKCCLDRWMDHDQRTCPLCRAPFVVVSSTEMEDEWFVHGDY